jgi:hypothetical protein
MVHYRVHTLKERYFMAKTKANSKGESAADRAIKAFGGARKLAAEIGVNPESVYRWSYPRSRRGCGGTIPSEWHRPILEAAERLELRLAPADLINF